MTKKITKIFFDTEFTGLHQRTTLISIGLIADLGPGLGTKSFYAELTDYDQSQVDEWIQENVICNLKNTAMPNNTYQLSNSGDINCRCDMEHLKMWLTAWLSFDSIEMWSDTLAFDWVLFCEIWAGALNIPKNIYYIPFDIVNLFKERKLNPDINRELFLGASLDKMTMLKHNSLWDAYVIMKCHNLLNNSL